MILLSVSLPLGSLPGYGGFSAMSAFEPRLSNEFSPGARKVEAARVGVDRPSHAAEVKS
jgi:hypothetical protein